ncbi:FUSC family protein [Streptomyces sp. 1222.5]|uniref:FUSC family protein n=1 Tax=Streptomyces sp. 1222.5 TaxID=1881026 RepID=UPI003D70BE4B
MTGPGRGRRTAGLFAPAAGSRPAVVAGLGNGVAISVLLLAGVAAGNAAAGAWAALGAYVTAFTNKGGPRGPRTRHLLVAAVVNAAMFWVGVWTIPLVPLTGLVLAVLVFLASMGSAVHPVLERLGTMPATALLVAAGSTTAGVDMEYATLLVLAGGLWYAAATAVLTPPARLRDVLAHVAQPYRLVGRHLTALGPASSTPPDASASTIRPDAPGDRARPPRTAPGAARRRSAADPAPPHVTVGTVHPDTTDALRRAEGATRELRGPRGDEHLADLTDPLVRHAATLADLTTALAATGPPPPAVRAPYAMLTDAVGRQLCRLADVLTRRRQVTDSTGGDPVPGLGPLEEACDRMRAEMPAGAHTYPEMARAGRQRRLLERITATLAEARAEARTLALLAATPLSAPPARPVRLDGARLRDAMTLRSGAFRHALRATVVSGAVFALVHWAALPHGEWAVLAVLRVMRPQYAVTRERVAQRVIGNVVGGTCAAVLIAAVHEPAALSLILFVVITVGFTLRPVNYAFWVVFGTPLVLLIGDVSHPGSWLDAAFRIAMTLLGTAAALVGSRLLWPSWEHPRLDTETTHARQACAAYLDTTLRSLSHDGPGDDTGPGPDVRRARTTAEKALAQAAATSRHAHREPGHDRAALDRAATTVDALTTLNLLVAALATHRTPRTARIPALAAYTDNAGPALADASPEVSRRHADALTDALDVMSLHLEELHVRRHEELATGRTGDTPARAAIRENGPVVELLQAIAAVVDDARARPRQETTAPGP